MPRKTSKRMQAIKKDLTSGLLYSFTDAVNLLKKVSCVKFTESVDVSINLDMKKSSEAVFRGAVVLPHGTGRIARVAVFAQGQQAEAAKEAGADVVGCEDLVALMKDGDLNFQVVIATPDTIPIVAPLGSLLGPRNIMPNPKLGTVTMEVGEAVKQAKTGQVRYRADKAGVLHVCIGKLTFESRQLLENFRALLAGILSKRTSMSKNLFKKITLSSTMGPGLVLDSAALDVV